MAETASSSQEHRALPTVVGTASPPQAVVEADVSKAPFVEEDVTEQATFTGGDMSILHECLGRSLPAPEAGFSSTALVLTSQLHELIGDHMDCVVPELANRLVVDLDRPFSSEYIKFRVRLELLPFRRRAIRRENIFFMLGIIVSPKVEPSPGIVARKAWRGGSFIFLDRK